MRASHGNTDAFVTHGRRSATTPDRVEPGAPTNHARERFRLARWATLTNFASRGLAMLLVVLGVRLTAEYLGATRFGVWATFASMAAMLSLLDLGVGNALVNRIAYAIARDDEKAVRQIATGGGALLALIGVAASGMLVVLALLLPWGLLMKLGDATLASEARSTAVVFAVCFGINLVATGLLRILAGQQRSHEANLLSSLATLFACLALLVASSRHAGVPWLLAATFGVQTLAGFAAGALLLVRGTIRMCHVGEAVQKEQPHLIRAGSLFVLLQLGTMLGWGSDSFILALVKGASEVAVYAVAFRLFQFASQPFAIMNAPLWAAYADAHARQDTSFIRHALRRSMTISVLGAAALSTALVLAGPWLVSTWTRSAITVPMDVLVLFAIWTVFDSVGSAFGAYLNGCGIVKPQVFVVLLFCATVLPLKLWLGSSYGVAGLLTAAIAAYLVVVVSAYAVVLRRRVLAPLQEVV